MSEQPQPSDQSPADDDRPTASALALLSDLLAFDTTSRNSNLDLIAYVRDFLAAREVESTLVHDADGTKANLYATLGPTDRPGFMLSGHTDVVPIDGQDWSLEPFAATERDGRIYGRGSCDMKGFIACVLGQVDAFLARDLAKPIHLAFSYDEEVGCLGVRGLIDQLRAAPIKPEACIVGEPTSMRVMTGHKGKLSTRCTVHGLEAHSSLSNQGVNAIEAAAEIVAFLKTMARKFRDEGPFDTAFDPPYTTVHTGTIKGGTALNIVPRHCDFAFEFRTLPGEDPETLLRRVQDFATAELLPEMTATAETMAPKLRVGFDWETISAFPGLDIADDDPLTVLARGLAGSNATGKVAFGTEAGLFQAAGIPAVICGPGDIAQAHKPDEWVTLDQLRLCERFLERLGDRLAA